MARTKANETPPLDLEEEREERAKYAGCTKSEIEDACNAIDRHAAKSSEFSGELSAKLELFSEKRGGNKRAIKIARMLKNLDPTERADLWRCINGYCDALGVFDQIDMFEQESENEKRADTISAASMPSETTLKSVQ